MTAAVAAGVVACSVFGAGPAGAVADGVAATTGMFPFSVKLTMTDVPRPDGTTYDSGCSAGLISPQWIITAGHCFHDVNRDPVSGPTPYPTTATIGTADVNESAGEVVDVVEVRQAGTNDIALAKLAQPIEGVPVLDIDHSAPAIGEELTLAGWGATSAVDPAPSTQLYYGRVAVSSVAGTTAGVQGVWPAADTSACLYDSGSPYFTENANGNATLVAVESNGPDCPHVSEETTSRADVIAAWIDQQIG
ncbi:MAG TPA: trypsin-like serine protease [Amycolatopsis sp.]|nr:trypsin-like serine protease [Amycolatopsis sp.]